jgi:ACR3 family arsenite transporter
MRPWGRWLLAANNLTVPWETIVLSVLIYVGLALLAGAVSRAWILRHKGRAWFKNVFLKYLSPVSVSPC